MNYTYEYRLYARRAEKVALELLREQHRAAQPLLFAPLTASLLIHRIYWIVT